LSIQLLLGEPNNDSALNADAAKYWNKEVYQKKLEKFESKMARKY